MFWKRKKKLAVGITCADWRLHQPGVNLYGRLRRELGVSGLDVNAVPGPDGLLLPERAGDWAAVLGWARLLIGAHHPVVLAVIAHQRCAGHPVSDKQHDDDVAQVAEALKKETGFSGPSAALVAVYHTDDRWSLKRIATF